MLKKLRQVAVLALASIFVSSCEADPSVRGVRGGPAVGVAAEWQPIAPGNAEFSILGDWALVRGWIGRNIQTRVQSQANLDGGWLMSERPFGTRTDTPASTSLQTGFDIDLGGTTRMGVPFAAGSPRTERTQATRIDYGVWRGANQICIAFRLYPENTRRFFDNGEFYQAYARGIRCANSGTAQSLNLEEQTLDLLRRVVFDSGAANRVRQPGGNPPSGSTIMPSPSPQTPAQSAPRTSPPSAVTPPAPSTPPGNSRDVETRLRELNRLRDGGLVTPLEYEARRRAILDAL